MTRFVDSLVHASQRVEWELHRIGYHSVLGYAALFAFSTACLRWCAHYGTGATELRCALTLAPTDSSYGQAVITSGKGGTEDGEDADIAAAVAASLLADGRGVPRREDADVAAAIAASLSDARGGGGGGGGGEGGREEGAEGSGRGEISAAVATGGGGEEVVVALAPLPYHVPPQPYVHLGGRDRPWTIDGDHPVLDTLGYPWPRP